MIRNMLIWFNLKLRLTFSRSNVSAPAFFQLLSQNWRAAPRVKKKLHFHKELMSACLLSHSQLTERLGFTSYLRRMSVYDESQLILICMPIYNWRVPHGDLNYTSHSRCHGRKSYIQWSIIFTHGNTRNISRYRLYIIWGGSPTLV